MTPTVLNGPYLYDGNPKILTRSRSPRIGALHEKVPDFMQKSFEQEASPKNSPKHKKYPK
jgi:hypothetical protein